MTEVEASDDLRGQDPEEPGQLEDRALVLLKDSKIDLELSAAKTGKKRGRKYKLKCMSRPMVMPETILEFLNEDLRENAIRYLSNYLVEKMDEDLDNYYRAGYLVFNSFGTMCLLVKEVIDFYNTMENEKLEARKVKRLINVLTLFQSVSANKETRQSFVNARVPDYLIPLILFDSTSEEFEDVRTVALSVIGILCQGRESRVIRWAINSDIIKTCCQVVDNGSELSKVIAMHILEALLHDDFGLSYICNPVNRQIIKRLIQTWNKLVALLSADKDFSPRLLFHSIRCYLLLCRHDRGYDIVKKRLPDSITNGSFHKVTEEFAMIGELLRQLLLSVGKGTEIKRWSPSKKGDRVFHLKTENSLPDPSTCLPLPSVN